VLRINSILVGLLVLLVEYLIQDWQIRHNTVAHLFSNSVHNDPFGSSKVADFFALIESGYGISYWFSIVTLVYLAPFQKYYRFCTSKATFSTPQLYSGQNFGVFPLE